MKAQRAAAGAALAVAVVFGLVGCQPKTPDDGAAPQTGGGTSTTGSAAAALSRLTVRASGSMATYDRLKDFGPAWTDSTDAPGGHNHCSTRDDILSRDLSRIKRSGRCTVVAGDLKDPYTGATIHFRRGRRTSSAVQIDHLVPLGNVWVSGGPGLSAEQRREIANDPLNLLSADGPANMGKSDDAADEWLPKQKAFDCEYVARQISVKAKYHLSVTTTERAAMQRVLAGCPRQPLPTESSAEVALKS